MNIIRDRNGKPKGRTETNSNGYIYIYSQAGSMKGYYIPTEDRTYRCGGGFYGNGNQLISLLD